MMNNNSSKVTDSNETQQEKNKQNYNEIIDIMESENKHKNT